MIVLNSTKELVRVEAWADIQGRPGFTDNLDPAAHVLSGIIGQYAFADKIHCGLSNCHTPHFRGYLVATKSGQETNIGKDCGKNYFGIDFENMAVQFDRDIRDKEARERLLSFGFKLDKLKATITALREGERGADWVADIRGLEALNQGNDLRQILILDLEENIKAFEPLSIDLLTSKELSKWSKWCGTVEQKLETASQALQIGLSLLSKQNLEPFMRLIADEDEQKNFKKYLNGIP